MEVDVLVAEIGSTTTVVTAIDGLSPSPIIMGQGTGPTTIVRDPVTGLLLDGDVLVGLEAALGDLRRRLGAGEDLKWGQMLATSSAAGGLRMTVHGLVYDMTAKAAREAALGAGAVVQMITAGNLTPDELDEVKELAPNIILLAGGVDHGDRAVVEGNARELAALNLVTPVVFAGNVACRAAVKRAFAGASPPAVVKVVPNVYPRIDDLEVEPARRAIQEIFEDHITRAPGMERLRELVDGPVTPTPGAVMKAAQVFAEAHGDCIVFDVGGATTDIHSVTAGDEEIARRLVAPEPLAKRTVEGDLGVFVNVPNLIDLIGTDVLEERLGFALVEVLTGEGGRPPNRIPQGERERQLARVLVEKCLEVALARHAGRTRHLYGPGGRQLIAEGKDLTAVKWAIGTGGALTRLGRDWSRGALERVMAGGDPRALYPKSPEVLIDEMYIMAAAGAVARIDRAAALALMEASFDGISPGDSGYSGG